MTRDMLQRTLAKRRTRARACNPLLPLQRLARALATYVPFAWGEATPAAAQFAFVQPVALPTNAQPQGSPSRALSTRTRRPRTRTHTHAHAPMSRVPVVPTAPLPSRVGSEVPSHAPPPITLSAKEEAIFTLLKRVRRDEGLDDLTLRVAGGWVRDKVLGREMRSVDIDIALDTLQGREFAEIVNNWMRKQAMSTHSIGVIQRNPDQSKHLETATMRVLDVWLDLVNLRTETYSHNSRIPDVQIGTPLEDALRRDLTINALFYNINTGVVEDLTGRGLDDIRAKIVRTPLPPLTTLLDDPLRALRAIRFASRLNFSFDHELFDACKNTDVRRALADKVSRERVATELDGIMKSARPTHALGLLVELGLHSIVFRIPADLEITSDTPVPEDFAAQSLSALLNLEAVWNLADDGGQHSPLARRLATPPMDTRIAAYAATLVPLAGVHCLAGKKRKRTPLVQYVCMEQLRMSSKDVKDIERVHEAVAKFRALAAADPDRLRTGLAVKHAGPRWRTALQLALVTEMSPTKPAGSYMRGVDKRHAQMLSDDHNTLDKFAQLMRAVESYNLDGVWDIKPVINGNEVLKTLPKLKKGQVVGQIMQKQIEWMIQNPNSGPEDAKQWLQNSYKDML